MPGTVPRGEAIHISAPLSLGCARSLVRPIFLCCSLYHAPGLFPCFFILPLAGPASHPAYAPTTKSPARYSAGRAKQHNHARNVTPSPLGGVRGEPSPGRRGAGSARCLVRPGRSALPGTVPRGEAIHISAPLSLGSAHCLFRPIFLCCSLYHAPGLFPCLFIFSLAGPARRRSPARFLLAKKGRFPVPLCAVV